MTEDQEQTSEDGSAEAQEPASASAGSGEAASAAPVSPEERIATLENEKREQRDRMLRIAAEFENWKKRARREQAELESKSKEAVLRDMLEVIDNLERANAAWTGTPDPQGVQQGVALVLRMFQSKLERYDVRAIEAKGQPFDPRVHDAISQVPTAEVPPGTIISELQRGYRIGDRLLRPASVVVAVAPSPVSPPVAQDGGSGPDGAGGSDGAGGPNGAGGVGGAGGAGGLS